MDAEHLKRIAGSLRLPKAVPREELVAASATAAMILIAVALRWLYLHQLGNTAFGAVTVGPDVSEYDAWAREILGGKMLWTRVRHHAPLYAYVLAGMYRLTGTSIMVVRGIQLILDVAAMLMVHVAVRRLWGRGPALAQGLLWATYLPLVYFSAEIVSEGLLVFLLSAALLLWVLGFRTPPERDARRLGLSAGVGFFFGLAAITHPLSLPLGVAVAFLTVCITRQEQGWPRAICGGVLMVVVSASVVAPVTCRNLAVSGEFTLVQSHEGLNFFIGNNPDATGTPYVRPGVNYKRLTEWPASQGITGENASKRFYYAQSLNWVRREPLKWARLLGRKLLLTWNAYDITSGPDLPDLQVETQIMRLPLPRFGILFPLALSGAWFVRKRREAWVLAAFPICYALALTVFVTSGRYRLGMVPVMMVFAGAGVQGFRDSWHQDDARNWQVGLALVLAGCLVAFAPAPPPLPGLAAESAQLRAEAAWEVRGAQQAEHWVTRGLAAEEWNPALNHLAGVVLTETGRADAAVGYLRRALERCPRDAEIRVDLAIALSTLGRTAEAKLELSRALEDVPECAAAWYNLGVLAEREGAFPAAKGSYERALESDPAHASAHLNLGVLAHRDKQHEQALAHYRAALRQAPRKSRTLTCLAVLMAETGRPTEARKHFERALAIDPGQPDVWRAYGGFLQSQGDTEGAERAFRRSQTNAPRSPEKN